MSTILVDKWNSIKEFVESTENRTSIFCFVRVYSLSLRFTERTYILNWSAHEVYSTSLISKQFQQVDL